MNIPLYASNKISREAAFGAVDAVLEKKDPMRSEACRRLEKEICAVSEAAHSEAVYSAESAFRSLLYAWSVGCGDAVFVPSFAEPAILLTVMECGAKPVMVDCDRETWNMDPEKLEKAVKKCIKQNEFYPRAVIVCDTFGLPFDAEKINAVCAQYGLLLIEDASCALGAKCRGKSAGTLGDGAVICFKQSLGINGFGSGGAVLTDDHQLAKTVRFVAEGGQKHFSNTTGCREASRRAGFAVLPEFIAELMIPLVGKVKENAERRIAIAQKLRTAAKETAAMPQTEREGIQSACPVFALRASDKESAERMVAAFREEGIECSGIFSKPMCRHGALKELGVNISDVPVGSELSVCTFVLPCHEELTDEQAEYICSAIKKICV